MCGSSGSFLTDEKIYLRHRKFLVMIFDNELYQVHDQEGEVVTCVGIYLDIMRLLLNL